MSTDESSHESFHRWLRRQLVRREWSSSDLARELGMGKGVVGYWTRGERVPSPASADRLADVLGVDRDLVLALAGHRSPTEALDPDSDEARLIAMIRAIKWDDERIGAIEGILSSYRDTDRRKRR